MKKDKKDDAFVKTPFYKGGQKAMQEFVAKNLVYPAASMRFRVEGDVHIRYSVNHKGEVTDTHIIGGLDDACNEEASRVVRLLRFEVPKTPRNLRVTFHKTIRIHFKLPAQKPATPTTPAPVVNAAAPSVTYTITPKAPVEEKKNTTITYTIRF